MARIRTIKPEFFTSLTIADLTPEQRLTFIGLWTHVDDEGRCVDDARLIKAAVWPLDDRTAADVEGDLNAIHVKDLIVRYVAKGKRCLSVAGWGEHQRINRPSPSKLPSPDEGTPTPPGDSLRTHGGLSEPSNAARTAPREGSQNPHSGPSGAPAADSASQQGEAPPSGQLTSMNGDAVSPHGALTEDSPPERNREQGKEQGTGNVSAAPPPPSALAPRGPDTPPGRPDVERICTHLADRIEGNGCKRPNITQKWRDAARLMLDKDGRTEQSVIAAIDWSQDHEFWRGNILSLPKLREKYDQLSLQARRGGGGTVVPISSAVRGLTGTDATVAGWLALDTSTDQEPR